MTTTRGARTKNIEALRDWTAQPQMGVTKQLVADRPPDPEGDLGMGYGPRDGDAVGVPAPCARLIAGYWCSCGSGFASLVKHEQISRARVEAAPDGGWRGYVDSFGGSIEPDVRWPEESERRDLQLQVEALPIGTVVERFGTGIAPRFGDTVRIEPPVDGAAVPIRSATSGTDPR